MPKTSTEVCTEALTLIGVVATDESATSYDYARAKDHMDAIFAHLSDVKDLALPYTVETVPDEVFLPFAYAIAGSVAGSYGQAQRAMEIAMSINPGKTLYEIGIDGLCEREARMLNHENHTVYAEYF